MSQYLVLSHIKIQNANSIAGFTWGFPAITHFLGFTHALSRKISASYQGNYQTEFSGCAVISHKVDNKVYQPKPYADVEFLQSKNPPVLKIHKAKSPPIIEEGKLNLTVSLVLELSEALTFNSEQVKTFEQDMDLLCRSMRIAGGLVLDISKVKLLSASTDEKQQTMLMKIKRLCMPGFVLKDRSEYLEKHTENLLSNPAENAAQPSLRAWLDFVALKFQAEPQLSENQHTPDSQTDANWPAQGKPFSGYLVPLMTGYKAISDLYEAGFVENTRDVKTPTRFVEPLHSVGEWLGMHKVDELKNFIWRYHQEGEWYLCQQKTSNETNTEIEIEIDISKTETEIEQQILDLF